MQFGVDVSEHQAGFDFTACPLDFAIIRTLSLIHISEPTRPY